MKYIKNYKIFEKTEYLSEGIFNFFKKKIKQEVLYRRIGQEEKEEFSNKKEPFTKKELALLYRSKCRNFNNIISDDGEDMGIRFSQKPNFGENTRDKYCELTKFEDEWYILYTAWRFRLTSYTPKYFMCDTIEGVIQALEENK